MNGSMVNRMLDYIIIATVSFAFGLLTIKYLVRHFRNIWLSINYFIQHKILKKPEPDPVETLMDLMPLVTTVCCMAELTNVISRSIKESKLEYIRNRDGFDGDYSAGFEWMGYD
jgi:hypothetical protein